MVARTRDSGDDRQVLFDSIGNSDGGQGMTDPQNLDSKLDAVYQSGGDRAKLDHIYDDWARNYDRDVWASGDPYIALLAGMAGRYIRDCGARILDGGCGTGNMAQILRLIGYNNIVGIDPSDGMLAAARAKGCYAELHKMVLGAEIDLPANSFDAVTAAGVLSHGHAPPESLIGLLAVAKPGAPILFSISRIAVEEGGFDAMFADLEQSAAWALEERTELFQTYPFSSRHDDLRHWVYVYRKAR
ncbi:MAG: class I SAM-dependent methyltransferase [Alphaproteobacteria bacterium]|nr:class I SAM-dependent methyltransferase [Alphaproteobacteria bacterium]